VDIARNAQNIIEEVDKWKKANSPIVNKTNVSKTKSLQNQVHVLSVSLMRVLRQMVRLVLFHHAEIEPKSFFQVLLSKIVQNIQEQQKIVDNVLLIHVL